MLGGAGDCSLSLFFFLFFGWKERTFVAHERCDVRDVRISSLFEPVESKSLGESVCTRFVLEVGGWGWRHAWFGWGDVMICGTNSNVVAGCQM